NAKVGLWPLLFRENWFGLMKRLSSVCKGGAAMNQPTAYLLLEDGSCFAGQLFGAEREVVGEVVVTTTMTGYQEIVTDPSSCGQIVAFTYPLIGNYGINQDDYESLTPYVSAIIVKEYSQEPSHWKKA